MATAAFAALPGAPAPDYIIDPNFFDPAGDTLNLFFYDMVSSAPVYLPIDNLRSVNHDLAIAVNTPTNFNDETGSICLIDLLGDLNDDCDVNLLDLAEQLLHNAGHPVTSRAERV